MVRSTLCLVLVIHLISIYQTHALPHSKKSTKQPNILFLIDESTESSAYFFGQDANTIPMPIPNLQALMARGVSFPNTYAAAPVCCPSRASIMSGRHVHHLSHWQENPTTGLWVDGAWNNHEGLPSNYTKWSDLLQAGGYAWNVFGKKDWAAGGHSVSARVTSWTNKVKFPYTLENNSPGWFDESGPIYHDKDTMNPNGTVHSGDWNHANDLVEWTKEQSAAGVAWAVQFSPNVCHPPYSSTSYWLSQVNDSLVTIPQWAAPGDMHVEDFYASMKKRMFGGDPVCCSDGYKRKIRTHYYANVAEYDSMVGTILDGIGEEILRDTWVVATSDHGDMNMEHRQYYKMSWYEGSARVPMIIAGGDNVVGNGKLREGVIEEHLISLLDIFPTLMQMANVPVANNIEAKLDGFDLMPFLFSGEDDVVGGVAGVRPDYVLSQFHGDEIHLSWFMLRSGQWKYVTYGSGAEVADRLFNLKLDPHEANDLSNDTAYAQVKTELREGLMQLIDFPQVASDVESYNKDSFVRWRNSFDGNETAYNITISNLRWNHSWAYDPSGCFEAIDNWLHTPNDTFHWAF